jgi:hypothetical protein
VKNANRKGLRLVLLGISFLGLVILFGCDPERWSKDSYGTAQTGNYSYTTPKDPPDLKGDLLPRGGSKKMEEEYHVCVIGTAHSQFADRLEQSGC